MKKKLCIVGTGISAMGCAYYLRDMYDITMFDKNSYIGGHTHTHTIQEGDKNVTIDTGFIVFNNETYPHLLQLFSDLGVEKRESDMGFSVWNTQTGLMYAGGSFRQFFAQPKRLFSLTYRKFIWDILKFFRVAKKDIQHNTVGDDSLIAYAKRYNLSSYFIDNFLVPMAAAVWSTSHEKTYEFPVALLLPFFKNHGLLGVDSQFQWYTVVGGSDTYTKKILEVSQVDVHIDEEVQEVRHEGTGVRVYTTKDAYMFDDVIVATHADTARRIVTDLPQGKRDILNAFDYSKNIAVLHTDDSVMPSNRSVWSSRNQVLEKNKSGTYTATTVYRVNKLQGQDTSTNYFISINPLQSISDKHIIKTIHYAHPLFTLENSVIQKRLPELNEHTHIYFAGSYFGYGFHEDGLRSALSVVDILAKQYRG